MLCIRSAMRATTPESLISNDDYLLDGGASQNSAQYPPFTPHQRPTKSPQAALHEGGAADQHSPQRGYGNGSCIWRQRGGVGFPGDGNYAPRDQQAIQSHNPAGDVASNVTPPTDAASSTNLAQQTDA